MPSLIFKCLKAFLISLKHLIQLSVNPLHASQGSQLEKKHLTSSPKDCSLEVELRYHAWSTLRVLEIPDKLTLYTAVNELVVAFKLSLYLLC